MSKDLFEPNEFIEKLFPDDLISRRAILLDILDILTAMPNDIDPDLKKGEFIGLMMAAKKVVNSKRGVEMLFCKNCKHWERMTEYTNGLGVCDKHNRVMIGRTYI